LIVNAKNDPFLGPECYPVQQARKWKYVYLEIPDTGGHVGFSTGQLANSYMEERALQFFEQYING